MVDFTIQRSNKSEKDKIKMKINITATTQLQDWFDGTNRIYHFNTNNHISNMDFFETLP